MDSTGGEEQTGAFDRDTDERRQAVKDVTMALGNKLEATFQEKCTADPNFKGVYKYHDELGGVADDVWIANPLVYAAHQYKEYIDLMQGDVKVLFVGMNSARKPLTGIPFHENKVHGKLLQGQPLDEGFIKWMRSDHVRDSDSGEIFWGCMVKYFVGDIKKFFRHCFVINYCPLIFMDEGRSRNVPLSELVPDEPIVKALMNDCRNAFQDVVKILRPHLIVTIGAFTYVRVQDALAEVDINPILKGIYQPVAITHKWGDIPLDEKIEKCKMQVGRELKGIDVWEDITKEYQVKQEEIGNEAKTNP